jgi:hypothetical protein
VERDTMGKIKKNSHNLAFIDQTAAYLAYDESVFTRGQNLVLDSLGRSSHSAAKPRARGLGQCAPDLRDQGLCPPDMTH